MNNLADKPVYLLTARDKVLRYLDRGRNMIDLQNRLAWSGQTRAAVYAQAVREGAPDLPHGYEDDVADMVRAALKARVPKVAKRVPGRAA